MPSNHSDRTELTKKFYFHFFFYLTTILLRAIEHFAKMMTIFSIFFFFILHFFPKYVVHTENEIKQKCGAYITHVLRYGKKNKAKCSATIYCFTFFFCFFYSLALFFQYYSLCLFIPFLAHKFFYFTAFFPSETPGKCWPILTYDFWCAFCGYTNKAKSKLRWIVFFLSNNWT